MNSTKQASCKVEGDEIVLRIPVDLAVFAFNNKDRDPESYGVITVGDESKFAEALAERIIEGEDERTENPHFGAMMDLIGEQMIEDGVEYLNYDSSEDE